MSRRKFGYFGSVVLALGLLGSANSKAQGANSPAQDKCAGLLTFTGDSVGEPSLRIKSAVFQAAQEFTGGGGASTTLPGHCEVFGELRRRDGAVGQSYAIKFHMRLPASWNGRFLFNGGGGLNGNIGTAIGNTGAENRSALEQGFAVVTQDSGHDNAINVDPTHQGAGVFGFDFEARRNYAYASHEVVTRVAKALVSQVYGRAPDYSYFMGCSKGGHEGMMMSQRYPTYFDGILSTAPGFTLPKLALATVWDVQAIAGVAKSLGHFDANGAPLLNRAYSDHDLELVADAIGESCDALDGVRDGMVQNIMQCTTDRVSPALAERTCSGEKAAGCLTSAQVNGLKRVFDGPRDSQGRQLNPPKPWDLGIGGRDIAGNYATRWRNFYIGPYNSDVNSAGIVRLSMTATSAVFTTPPTTVSSNPSDLVNWALKFDFDRDSAGIFATNEEFPESPWDMMAANSLDRTQFRDAGGKMLILHGGIDENFTFYDLAQWWTALDNAESKSARQFVRLYNVPGMAHCGGGFSTDRYDALTTLMNWVEKGEAPERISAKAGPATPWPGRTRPLCPFPTIAHYRGTGNIEDEANFTCEIPT